jgi:hypothetical protein
MEAARVSGATAAGSQAAGGPAQGFRGAIGFWEPRRLVYNLLLIAVVAGWVVATWPHFVPASTPFRLHLFHLFQLTVLGLLANLCYSAAYLAEVLLQALVPSAVLPRLRRTLWVAGMLLAIVFENYWIADEIYPFVH